MGLSVCRQLARDHRRVAILDLDGDAAETAAESLRAEGLDAISGHVDVSDRASVDDAMGRVRDELGAIGILVTSAAVASFTPFEEVTLDAWRRTLEVNLTGTFNCIQSTIKDMVEAGWGRIVTISSAAGQIGSPRQSHYSASKGGVIALTKSVALEFAGRGITANTIPPFAVDTPMLRAEQAARHLPGNEVLTRMIPSRRLGTGDDIAAMCAFLCSDAAGYVTGQVVGVNGGAVT